MLPQYDRLPIHLVVFADLQVHSSKVEAALWLKTSSPPLTLYTAKTLRLRALREIDQKTSLAREGAIMI